MFSAAFLRALRDKKLSLCLDSVFNPRAKERTSLTGIISRTPRIKLFMGKNLIFDEKYRVVSVERDRLLLRGERSGDVLTVINPAPETPLTQEEYPVGVLIALTDPSCAPPN